MGLWKQTNSRIKQLQTARISKGSHPRSQLQRRAHRPQLGVLRALRPIPTWLMQLIRSLGYFVPIITISITVHLGTSLSLWAWLKSCGYPNLKISQPTLSVPLRRELLRKATTYQHCIKCLMRVARKVCLPGCQMPEQPISKLARSRGQKLTKSGLIPLSIWQVVIPAGTYWQMK